MRLLIVTLVFLLGACQEKAVSTSSLDIVTRSGQTYPFNIELALTQNEQMKGLMFRESMPEETGMLFYFGGEEAERGFWMKNTLIPLDLLFIRGDGTIHYIHKNAVPHDLTSIRSNGAVAAVLEINGGLTSKLGIKEGDIVKHAVFQLK